MDQRITLEINGEVFEGFETAAVITSMRTAAGGFTFTISSRDSLSNYPIKAGSPCRVLIESVPVITGYIEKITITYNDSSHDISISGRDKTCDIIDSTLGGGLSFASSITIIDLAKKILSYLGITDIKVYTKVQNIAPLHENFALSCGETAFDFIERFAKKRQLLVVTDGEGNLVFARTEKNRINTVLNSSANTQPTIKEASFEVDNTKRFYQYILNTQVSTSGIIGLKEIKQINAAQKTTTTSKPAYDTDIRHTRIFNLMSDEQGDVSKKELDNRAIWEANFRKSRSKVYKAKVQGFRPINDPDIIWKPNLLVKVIDQYCDIPEELLVASVTYNYDLSAGSTTQLELIDKQSFTVDIFQTKKYHKDAGKSGQDIITSFPNS